MSHFVPRTCTEIGEDGVPIEAERASDDSTDWFKLLSGDDSPAESEGSSRSLEDFRESDAYVLLGAPGAGKTMAFRREAGCGGGHYVTARDFITFDADDRPEWHEATLFIDGLDEMRAGAADGRTPLDGIRAKLDRLGRPRFRLSCREADWFGANDREHLKSVSGGGEVKVLRLDPLSEDGIRDLLAHHSGIEDAYQFSASARERGIGGLLANPQSLLMLAQAVLGGSWPETRMQTFELACKRLVLEHNTEHRLAHRSQELSECELLRTAGRLCAVQLLTGRAGYVLLDDGSGSEYLGLQRISDGNQATLRHVLGTRLFESPGENHVAPIHRQIAEFLAGRYLAQLIGNGLPVGRVLALMTGEDGGVVSELRGLSAWLAAHDQNSRKDIIDRDPFGIVLYGDVRGFSREERRKILDCLSQETKKNSWFSSVTWIDSRLGDLATTDMGDVFREILTNPARSGARQRLVFTVLQALTYGQATVVPSDLLMRIVRDDSWWSSVRRQALDALLIRYQKQGTGIEDLRALMTDVHAGSISDPNDDLIDALLRAFYPSILPAPELFQYLKTPQNSSNFEEFWTTHVPEESTNMQLAELLDAIIDHLDQLRPVLLKLDGISATLLSRYLQTAKDVVSPEKLFDWLKVASDLETSALSKSSEYIKSWLTSHPDIQKEIITIGVVRCTQSSNSFCCMNKIRYLFYHVRHPPDFGYWCLKQAIAAADSGIQKYFIFEVADAVYNHRYDEGLSHEIVEEFLADYCTLSYIFTERLKTRKDNAKEQQKIQDHYEEKRKIWKMSRLSRWQNMTKPQQVALRENRCDPAILHQLAMVYFGISPDIEGDTPAERFHNILGDDQDLIGAVLDGLRGSVNRTDVPKTEEIIRLRKEKQSHFMILPFLAALEETGGPPDERRMRQALAAYYMRPVRRLMNQRPIWYESVLKSHADVAADILVRSIRAQIRSSSKYIFGTECLRDSDEVARLASMPLLETFPIRCSSHKLSELRIFLDTALRFCEEKQLIDLIDRKLTSQRMNVGQRVYWLTTGFFASESSDLAEPYRERIREYVSQTELRSKHLATFVDGIFLHRTGGDWIYPERIGNLDTPTLQLLIKLMATSYRPAKLDSHVFDSKSYLICKFMDKLASFPSPEATEALESLSGDDTLRSWKAYLDDALDRQNTVRREAGFHHPDVDQVLKTLDGGNPANVADLAALTFDFLTEIARDIRDGNTSDWRQYWHWDEHSHRQRSNPMHEDHCRDRLLSDLRSRVEPLGIDAAPEGRYADEKRSDIRVSCGGFNVPVEIKKSNHQNLWSAIRNQLIAKYTRDPGAGGHGIYLVFWFGKDYRQPPPESRSPPGSATELDERLRDTLSPEEARMIRVCVIDVAGAPERKQDVQVGRGRKKGSA